MDKKLEYIIDKLHFLREEIDLILEEYDFNEKAIKVRWNCFIESLESIHDPLLLACMKGAIYEDIGSGVIEIRFKKGLKFLKEWIEESQDKWIDLFHKQFGECVMPSFEFKD